MMKQEALEKLRETVSDHFTGGAAPIATTEGVRWWIRKCQQLGATEAEINAVLDSEIVKARPSLKR